MNSRRGSRSASAAPVLSQTQSDLHQRPKIGQEHLGGVADHAIHPCGLWLALFGAAANSCRRRPPAAISRTERSMAEASSAASGCSRSRNRSRSVMTLSWLLRAWAALPANSPVASRRDRERRRACICRRPSYASLSASVCRYVWVRSRIVTMTPLSRPSSSLTGTAFISQIASRPSIRRKKIASAFWGLPVIASRWGRSADVRGFPSRSLHFSQSITSLRRSGCTPYEETGWQAKDVLNHRGAVAHETVWLHHEDRLVEVVDDGLQESRLLEGCTLRALEGQPDLGSLAAHFGEG